MELGLYGIEYNFVNTVLVVIHAGGAVDPSSQAEIGRCRRVTARYARFRVCIPIWAATDREIMAEPHSTVQHIILPLQILLSCALMLWCAGALVLEMSSYGNGVEVNFFQKRRLRQRSASRRSPQNAQCTA